MSKRARASQPRDPRWIAFGKRLKTLRKARDWMGMDVARLADIDPVTYSRLENGWRRTGPERETLARLARLYELSTDDLLGEPHVTTPAQAHAARDVFPPAAPERPDFYEAVSDALYAVLQDMLSGLGEARNRRAGRTAADAPRENRRSGTDLAGRDRGH